MRFPFTPPANPGAAATAVLLDTGAVEIGQSRPSPAREHVARGIVNADVVVTIRHVWYAPGSSNARVLATVATTAGTPKPFEFATYPGRNVVEVVTTTGPATWEVSAELSDQPAGGGGLSGVLTDAIVFGAADGSGTFASNFTWDTTNRRITTTGPSIGLRQTGAASTDTRFDVVDLGATLHDETTDFVQLTMSGPAESYPIVMEGRAGTYKTGARELQLGGTSGALVVGRSDKGMVGHQHSNLVLFTVGYALLNGSGLGVMGLGRATTAPSTTPSGGVVMFVDGADGLAVRDPGPIDHQLTFKAAGGTTDTTGYQRVRGCNGAPTGVPSQLIAGVLAHRYDYAADEWYVYNGGWVNVDG